MDEAFSNGHPRPGDGTTPPTEPEPPDFPDKLAWMCATRPVGYLSLRALAGLLVLLGLTFLLDGIAGALAFAARSSLLLWLLTDEISNSEDREVLSSAADGLPDDAMRLGAVVVLAVLAVGLQLLLTRGRGPDQAWLSASAHGRPWPGRWRWLPEHRRQLGVAVGLTSSLALVFWAFAHGFSVGQGDWVHLPVLAIGLAMLAVVAAWGACTGGRLLLQILPTMSGPGFGDVRDAGREAVQEHARASADRWPVLPPLHLDAAVAVLSRPPPPGHRRRDRRRTVPWSGSTTSMEALAAALVVEALRETERLGLATVTVRLDGRSLVTAVCPPGRQPHGLAVFILGRHREGTRDGARAAASSPLPRLVDAFADVDPHAAVLRAACADLEAHGVAERLPDGWCLRPDRLQARAADLPSPRLLAPSLRDARMLRRVSRHLRRRRTTTADSAGPGLFLAPFTWSSENATRRAAALPRCCDDETGETDQATPAARWPS